jgi:uncharacterized protein with HEPN domain
VPIRETETYLRDILRSAQAIEDFLIGLTLDAYRADLKTRSAVERQLQILTEAVFRLGPDVETLSTTVDWRALRGLGNFIRHEYDDIDDQIVWDAIHQQLPPLILVVRGALTS